MRNSPAAKNGLALLTDHTRTPSIDSDGLLLFDRLQGVIPSWTVDVSKYYLWIEGVDLQGSHFFDTSLRSHIQVLRACLREFATALNTDQHDEICNYIDFVHQADRVQDSKDHQLVFKKKSQQID